MKFLKCKNGEINDAASLMQALNIDVNKKMIISFVGGGGKTSLIYQLGNELSNLGKKVIITTTTHMFRPKSNVVLTGKKEDIIKTLYSENMITVGMLSEKNHDKANLSIEEMNLEKITGLPEKISKELINLADFVLVEADGSKRLPLKMPAVHEPVIFEGSDLVIGVCGIDAIGKSIKEVCHRKELVTEFLEANEEHKINEEDVAKILCSEKGQRKDVKCDYKIIINKVDDEERLNMCKKILDEFLKLHVNEIILTTFKK